jgi:hypothetical protein
MKKNWFTRPPLNQKIPSLAPQNEEELVHQASLILKHQEESAYQTSLQPKKKTN